MLRDKAKAEEKSLSALWVYYLKGWKYFLFTFPGSFLFLTKRRIYSIIKCYRNHVL